MIIAGNQDQLSVKTTPDSNFHSTEKLLSIQVILTLYRTNYSGTQRRTILRQNATEVQSEFGQKIIETFSVLGTMQILLTFLKCSFLLYELW